MNKLLVVDEHRYYRTPDGKVWIPSQNDYNFWKRYLAVFERVKVVSRIEDIDSVPEHMLLSSGQNIEFVAISNYVGPYQYLKNIHSVRKQLRGVFDDCSHAIFRLPSELSFNIIPSYLKSNKPFGIELLIDPWDALSPRAAKSVVSPIVRLRWYFLVKKYCKIANGVAYVTKYALQKRYPCKSMLDKGMNKEYFTANYSSIDMDKSFIGTPKQYEDMKSFIITHVGTMHNLVKGQDVLLKAIKLVKDKGFKVKVNLVGDGRIKNQFIKLAKELKIDKDVDFVGHLKGSGEVRDYLIKSDLFVFPTKAEGLPRVIIEAMACGLPCISTPVNGTPELIRSDLLVEATDIKGFSEKIQWLISNPNMMESISKKNIEIASEYTADKLQIKRTEFYRNLYAINQR